MQFNLFLLAISATTALVHAAPADNTNPVTHAPAGRSAALKFLLGRGHEEEQDGPAPPGCYWDGTAPFCAGSCLNGYTEENRGPCGDGACCVTGYKALCCRIAATQGFPPGGSCPGSYSSSSSLPASMSTAPVSSKH
ncbi:hypothetical protein CPC08DRAFT_713106 [Agrocybe pediades]|nr:hypothetical protein CPC08DRAFT_713106 [Agrocybe pediades]